MLDLSKYSLASQIMALKMTGQVGPRTFEMLIAHFSTVENILLAEEEELLALPGIGPARSKGIFGAENHLDRAQDVIDNLEASDTKVVTCLDPIYPQMLYELNDPPLLLYYQGHLPLEGEKRAAVIGSQDVSAEGISEAVLLARKLAAEGVAIVGGLARGIDTAGHLGALKDNGVTYAVLPSGFNQIHPAENQLLTREIIRDGGLLSEYLPDTPAAAGQFISRNRLIVGLSHAVVIGEVSPESVGTLDAARCCHELGKLLFVLVGKQNPHLDELIGYGAIPLASIEEYTTVIKVMV
jgi:DNA processing protein